MPAEMTTANTTPTTPPPTATLTATPTRASSTKKANISIQVRRRFWAIKS